MLEILLIYVAFDLFFPLTVALGSREKGRGGNEIHASCACEKNLFAF
jgi:hypothetical protein